MPQVPINTSFLRIYNRSQILNLIREKRALSRVDLSKATGLSRTAVGSLISELIDEDYIEETGNGMSRGGRKPILLQLKPKSYFSFGVDITTRSIRIVIIDLLGSIIGEECFPLEAYKNIKEVLAFIEIQLGELIQRYTIPFERIVGICLTIPGAVNNETNFAYYSPSLSWENIQIPTMFDSLPNINVVIENDANACAVFEHWLGSCKGVDNFVSIVHTTGIGAGVFIDGALYRGVDGVSAQIGHIQVNENGPLCRCGNYGCLEMMAGHENCVEKFKTFIRKGIAIQPDNISLEEIDYKVLQNEAQNGNTTAKIILEEAATYLGISMSIIITILNPSKIVFAKGYKDFSSDLMDVVNTVANNKVMKVYKSKFNITNAYSSDNTIAYGAAIIPLKPIFGEGVNLC